MKLFRVHKGTPVKVIADHKEWVSFNFVDMETTKDNIFTLEEMTLDPTGCGVNHCLTPDKHPNVVGDAWVKAGYYGFNRDGYTCLVGWPNVELIG